jgi:hypothetical protein
MCRVVDVPVRAEFGLYVLIAQKTHLCGQMFAMRPQQASVEWYRGQDGHRRWPEAISCRCRRG